MPDMLKPASWIGWRKVLAFHSALIAVTWLGLAGRMDSSALSFTITGIFTAVVAGNAAVHIAGNVKSGGIVHDVPIDGG